MPEPPVAVLVLVVREALGITFLVAGVLKALRPGPLFALVGRIIDAPARSARSVAAGILITSAEVAIGIGFVSGVGTRVWCLLALGLMVVFTVALRTIERASGTGSCLCFGALDTAPVGALHYVRNVTLVGGIGFVLWASEWHPGARATLWAMPLWIPAVGSFTFLVNAAIYAMAGEIAKARFR